MKRFDEMTEEEIVQNALKAIPDYLESIRETKDFSLDRCIRLEVRRVEDLYKAGHGLSLYAKLDRKTMQTIEAVTAHFIPMLMERTLPVQQRYLKEKRISMINAATAKVLIPETFRKAGLEAEVTGQKYRAKVVVPFSGTSVRFYVRYRDMGKEGHLDGLVQAALDLKTALDKLGYGAALKKR